MLKAMLIIAAANLAVGNVLPAIGLAVWAFALRLWDTSDE